MLTALKKAHVARDCNLGRNGELLTPGKSGRSEAGTYFTGAMYLLKQSLSQSFLEQVLTILQIKVNLKTDMSARRLYVFIGI
jgi:hypothetical protein